MHATETPYYIGVKKHIEFISTFKPDELPIEDLYVVVSGLFNKVFANSKTVLLLLKEDRWEEASILLRPIYEATLKLNYYYYHPEEIQMYKDLSIAYKLKMALNIDKSFFASGKKLEHHENSIKSLQINLKDSVSFKDLNLTDEVLNNPTQIHKRLLVPNDVKTNTLKNKLIAKNKEQFQHLNFIDAQIYQYPSESIHAMYSSIENFHLFEDTLSHLFYMILQSLILLLYSASYAPCQVKIIQADHKALNNELLQLLSSPI